MEEEAREFAMPSPALDQIIERAFTDEAFARRLETDREAALSEYQLSDDEKTTLMSIGKRYGPDVQGYDVDQAYQNLGLGGSDPKTERIKTVLKCSF
jgi:hypothetical protein